MMVVAKLKYLKALLVSILCFQLGGCIPLFSAKEIMNSRFPAEHFFFNERAEMGQAIYQNDLSKVKRLIAQGVNVNTQPANNQGFTYLMYAVFLKDRFEITKYLLENGADPNQISVVDFPEYKSKYVNIANQAGQDVYLPLSLASSNRKIDYIKLLLKYGAKANRDLNKDSYYKQFGGNKGLPLFAAVDAVYNEKGWSREDWMNDIKKRIDLLISYGADINEPNYLGLSLVDESSTNLEITEYLMNKGATPKLYGEKLAKKLPKLLIKGRGDYNKRLELLKRLEKMGYRYKEE
ncbi:hypothetical protein RO21_06705 [[Actinobacillus] muris]|uniref:Uncharacterized protein n=1 Tax=Muribacter muris TaxID=67855 RepID=A0A0J5P4N5_9PAST|nr:ankyrin repeat domain-containing protein [Muribacter muris]KMK51393.1 hypothetical protein RO21_06705 [[Actinobacillus] muris] [Muribacter muris]